ncbi:oxidoreductase [Xylaria intraflava]|nr:oxidoreductase [Xylaria intraflava]
MDNDSFDFVIAGGGTAGITLATRLSEVSSQRVLVLEAGLDHSDDPRVKIPPFYTALWGSQVDWGFRTVPQEHMNGRSVNLSQGKTLGGSSAINALVYAPPTKELCDAWAELGNEGWNWDNISPYFAKAFTPPQAQKGLEQQLGIDSWDSEDMNSNGPVRVSYPGDAAHPLRKIWAETFRKKGYPTKSWSQASVGGFSNFSSIDPVTRERNHAAKAYYTAAKDRENLHVVLDAHVNKIIFADDEPQPKAVGLRYSHGGKTKIAYARKEVVICAGALQSPKLLELSGIGNANILKQHGIEAIKDLPGVGENLQDHILSGITYDAVDDLETLDSIVRKEPEATEEAMRRFSQEHSGILTSSGILNYAYLPIIDSLANSDCKKLVELIEETRPAHSTQPEAIRAKMYHDMAEKTLLDPNRPSAAYLTVLGQGPPRDLATGLRMPPALGKHLFIAAILAQPLSRGTVHIVSNDPSDSPQIDPKFFSNPLDVEVLARHILYIESLADSEPLSGVFKQPLRPTFQPARLTDLDAAKQHTKSDAISMWHPAGTCAMLPAGVGGVVDSSLKVHGVHNLRIVDASVVPLLPPGNMQSTIYAFAERAADIIKEAHGLKK